MADQNTEKTKMSSDCFAKIPEMMRNMMSKKGGSCCPCTETLSAMMQECCPGRTEKESTVEKQGQDAPK